MGAIQTLLNRLLQGAALVLAVVVLNFLLVHAAPGDPVETIAGVSGGMSEEVKAQLRAQYGLDKPLWMQLGIYLGNVLSGDLGYSFFFNLPVASLIGDRVPATLLLMLTAVISAFLIGTTLGVLSSRKPNGWLSQFINTLSLLGFAAPVFWTGILLVILLASVFPIFPISGMRSVDTTDIGSLAQMLDVLHHLVLPATSLGLIYLAIYSRLARASMLDVLGADYIRTARAKGLSELRVLLRHALAHAAVPIVTVIGIGVALLIGGVVVTETVFAIPGLGSLTVDAVLNRDFPVIQGLVLFFSVSYVWVNLCVDLSYLWLDPRIRY